MGMPSAMPIYDTHVQRHTLTIILGVLVAIAALASLFLYQKGVYSVHKPD